MESSKIIRVLEIVYKLRKKVKEANTTLQHSTITDNMLTEYLKVSDLHVKAIQTFQLAAEKHCEFRSMDNSGLVSIEVCNAFIGKVCVCNTNNCIYAPKPQSKN